MFNLSVNIDEMTDNGNFMSVPQTTFEIYCIFLYSFILYSLIVTKRAPLKRPFFKIFISTGFMDILSLISNMYMRLSQQFRLGPEQSVEYMWANYLSGVSLTGHLIGNILLQCNRFTSVVMPTKHLAFWTPRSLCLAIFLQYFLAITTKLFYFNYPIPYDWDEDNDQWNIGSLPTDVDIVAKIINITTSTIYAIIGIVFNFFIIRRLSQMTTGNNLTVNTNERGLVFYSIVLFIVAMLMSTQQIVRMSVQIFSPNDDDLLAGVAAQYFWINYLLTCLPLFSILVFSKEVRWNIFQTCATKNPIESTTLPIGQRKGSSGPNIT